MENLKAWEVQDFVANQPAGATFGAREVNKALGFSRSFGTTHVLNDMLCLGVVDRGKGSVFGSARRNIYKKLSPNVYSCRDCPFVRSGTGGCISGIEELKFIFEANR